MGFDLNKCIAYSNAFALFQINFGDFPIPVSLITSIKIERFDLLHTDSIMEQ